MQLTLVSPVGPYHSHLIPSVKAQVTAQNVTCAHVIIEDKQGRGAGWARNQGLAQVTTPFVAFLDADDQIAPTWAEETLAAFEASGRSRYIYTDHVQDGKRIDAPKCAWVRNTWHVITALIPTDWARRAGGFDQTMPAFEDTSFFLALRAHGYCGTRLARPLFHYGAGGRRSSTWFETPFYEAAMRYFTKQYGGRNMGSCCGDPVPGDRVAVGERLAGDVLAEATWAGNRPQRGRATGRVYRTGNWKPTWVDPADVALQPELWREIREDAGPAPDFDYTDFIHYARETGDDGGILTSVEEISAFIMQGTQPPEGYEPPPEAIRVEDAPVGDRPSAAAITAKARRASKSNGRQPPRPVAHSKGA